MRPDQLLHAHATLQVGCFFDGIEEIPSGVKYAFSKTIGDSFWNYAYGIKSQMTDLPAVLSDIRNAARQHDRIPAVYLTPDSVPSGLDNFLAHDGTIEDVWMTFRGDSAPAPKTELDISPVQTAAELGAFLDTFRSAYGAPAEDGHEVGYSGLPEEYPRAIQNAAPSNEVQIVNFIGALGGNIVAIASIYMKPPSYAGLYNVGVITAARQRGLGAAISRHAIQHALVSGCTDIFLMTVPDSPVEKLYSTIGFDRAFIGRIVALSS